jgi:hypothetical protein
MEKRGRDIDDEIQTKNHSLNQYKDMLKLRLIN